MNIYKAMGEGLSPGHQENSPTQFTSPLSKKTQSPAPRTTSANTCTVIRVHFQPHDRQESSGTGSHSHSPSCSPLCVINRGNKTVKRGSREIGLALAALHFTGNHWINSKQKNQCFTLLQVFSDSKLLQD